MDVVDKITNSKIIWEVLQKFTPDDLERAIILCSDSYYNDSISLISDDDYDILIDRLKRLNPNSKALVKTGALPKGRKNKLPYWMGSMNKFKSDEKMLKGWTAIFRGPYIISDKLDGISCMLDLRDEKITLYTRGNGEYGQNISHLIELINLKIKHMSKFFKLGKIAIRGELIMSKIKFEKYSKSKVNARNMVGGIVISKSQSIKKKEAADIDFVAYEVIEPNMQPFDQFMLLNELGFNVVYYDMYQNIDEKLLQNILEKRKKNSIYEIDGIIITDDNKHKRNTSGNPEYSFAYKGLSQTANVKVREVIWTPSPHGYLIPRINYEAIFLSQANLQFTTGFNAQYIVENGIGPGAIITLIRSGDTIPYILDVVKKTKPSLPPVEFVWDKNNVNIILSDIDSNQIVIIKRISKFMNIIGVDNLSEGIVKRLVEAGYDTIIKILKMKIKDYLEISGFKKTLATKIYNSIQQALVDLDVLKLMIGSNIFGRGIGERKIKKILTIYPNIADVYVKADRNKWIRTLNELEGFNNITSEQFVDSLDKFKIFYDKIKKVVKIKPFKSSIKSNGLFKDMKVVFTGFRNKDWEKFVEEQGGKISQSVSSNTSLVVYKGDAKSKHKKATELGIKTISYDKFAKKYKI